jgi:hypothetical protein
METQETGGKKVCAGLRLELAAICLSLERLAGDCWNFLRAFPLG